MDGQVGIDGPSEVGLLVVFTHNTVLSTQRHRAHPVSALTDSSSWRDCWVSLRMEGVFFFGGGALLYVLAPPGIAVARNPFRTKV